MNLLPLNQTDDQEPADTVWCDWCGIEVPDDCNQLTHAPYCSIVCAIDAEINELPEWSADND